MAKWNSTEARSFKLVKRPGVILHRWEKGEDYVEIEKGFSTNSNAPAIWVNAHTSDPLPLEFNEQVPASKESDLVSRLGGWAVELGYERAPI
jgi:hypothetical protein